VIYSLQGRQVSSADVCRHVLIARISSELGEQTYTVSYALICSASNLFDCCSCDWLCDWLSDADAQEEFKRGGLEVG
jgi:hypothetical protein